MLTTTTPGVTPFGQSTSTTAISRTATSLRPNTDKTSITTEASSSATSSPVKMTSISGQAIAGAVAGSVLALVAMIAIVFFVRRRRRVKKQQERRAISRTSEQDPRPYSDRFMYAHYTKSGQAFPLSAHSPPMHSRQPSDGMDMFGLSPPQSELGGPPFSPECVSPRMGPVELEVTNEDLSKKTRSRTNQ